MFNMFIFFNLFVTCVSFTYAASISNFDNGWKPLSDQEIVEIFKISIPEKPYLFPNFNWRPSEDINDLNILRRNAVQVIIPENITARGDNDDRINVTLKKSGKLLESSPSVLQVSDISNNITEESKTTKNVLVVDPDVSQTKEVSLFNVNPRKAKNINHYDGNEIKKLDETQDVNNNERRYTNAKYNNNIELTYDVKERDQEDEETESPIKKPKPYIYKSPVFKMSRGDRNDLNTRFYKILSRYNIRPDDMLTNYFLSRTPSKLEIVNKFNTPLAPVIAFPDRYNNLNHLSVDPLLAVYLSNYGYYMRGSYGLQNNYKNLYGYTASNNIHNNRPFGMYKLFSDTDSSQ